MSNESVSSTTDPRTKVPRSAMGCAIKSSVLSVVALAGGIYLLGRWETLNGASRAAAIVLVIVGTVLLLPIALVLLIAIGKYYFRKKITDPLKDALAGGRQMVEQNKQIYVERHEYRPASDADFSGRDRDWYESAQQELESAGFRWLGDRVNVTVERASGMVVVLRRFVSADGTTMSAIYQYVKTSSTGATTIDLRICDFETELTDGSFIATSNAAASRDVTMPPPIRSAKYDADTPMADLLRLHEEGKAKALADSPGVTLVEIRTMEEYEAAQDRQQAIKAAFRKGIGYVDPQEVRRIAERKHPDDPAIAAMATASADIARKQAQAEEKKD